MRVAVVSNRNVPGDPDRNLRDHLEWVRKAAGRGARLVLFPELSLSGYSARPFMREAGLRLEGRRCRRLIDAAGRHDVFVAFGLALRRRGRPCICHALAGPRGLVGHYEKVHLAGRVKGEGAVFAPGRRFRVFDVDGVGVGVNICMDGRYPGSSLCLAHLGAELILHPHGNVVSRLGVNPRDWTNKKRAYLGPRAVDTCTYMLICNSVGDVRDPQRRLLRFSGGALVLDPKGRFVARSPGTARRPHMIVADLDIAAGRALRAKSPIAARRPEVYVEALTRPGTGPASKAP